MAGAARRHGGEAMPRHAGMSAKRDVGEAEVALIPSEVFDQPGVVTAGAPEVNQEPFDFDFRRKQLADGEESADQLPDGSSSRRPARRRHRSAKSVPAG